MYSKFYSLNATTPTLNDGRPGSVFVRETRFSRDNHLEMEGVDPIAAFVNCDGEERQKYTITTMVCTFLMSYPQLTAKGKKKQSRHNLEQ
jgi:hypothetical protein